MSSSFIQFNNQPLEGLTSSRATHTIAKSLNNLRFNCLDISECHENNISF